MSCFNELPEGSRLEAALSGMRDQMIIEGKSDATVSKYLRDARRFIAYAASQPGSPGDGPAQETVKEYRDHLSADYKTSSVNSMLAGPNYLFRYCGREELRLHSYRIHREAFRDDERYLTVDEYRRLIKAASEMGKERLCMIMLTLGSTGIRISELPFITVESLAGGSADVSLKGRTRNVIIPATLCAKLSDYAERSGIAKGSIFVTKSGTPIDRSNILHDMKKLCGRAGVAPHKVHPHNLRHLFAVTYYDKYRDIAHLADILGHSNINTTRIYTAVRRGDLARSIESLNLADV